MAKPRWASGLSPSMSKSLLKGAVGVVGSLLPQIGFSDAQMQVGQARVGLLSLEQAGQGVLPCFLLQNESRPSANLPTVAGWAVCPGAQVFAVVVSVRRFRLACTSRVACGMPLPLLTAPLASGCFALLLLSACKSAVISASRICFASARRLSAR